MEYFPLSYLLKFSLGVKRSFSLSQAGFLSDCFVESIYYIYIINLFLVHSAGSFNFRTMPPSNRNNLTSFLLVGVSFVSCAISLRFQSLYLLRVNGGHPFIFHFVPSAKLCCHFYLDLGTFTLHSDFSRDSLFIQCKV